MHLPLPPLPRLPASRWLLWPIGWVPHPALEALVVRVARHLLAEVLQDGSLDFLEGRILAVRVRDPELPLRLTLKGGRLCSAGSGIAHATISARADDLLLLVAGRIDPDTLFFHRRLRLRGDTELGLAVKNVLDTIDLKAIPEPVRHLLGHLADVVETR
jgi:O2-independent ubiquinone biosynthesis accessory factor UbiT